MRSFAKRRATLNTTRNNEGAAQLAWLEQSFVRAGTQVRSGFVVPGLVPLSRAASAPSTTPSPAPPFAHPLYWAGFVHIGL